MTPSNSMKMNDSKTELMEFYSPYTPFSPKTCYTIDEDCSINPADKAKNLGFWFDQHLNLDSQIKNVSKTCHENLRNLGRIGSKLSKGLKIQLVNAYIHSVIDNCNGTYFAISNLQLRKLQQIQNTAAKFIFNLRGKERFQSMSPFLKELHFLPVVYRIRFKIALMAFKCINNLAPTYLSSLLSLRQTKSHSVRADNDVFKLSHPPIPRCKKTQGAFCYSAPRVWNSLPFNLRCMTDVQAFKSALKTHLFKCAFMDSKDTNDMLDCEI